MNSASTVAVQGFFTKFLVGGNLLSRTIFSPCRGRSQMGVLTLGMESDEGGLGKKSTEVKMPPYSKIRANFGVLSIKKSFLMQL